MRRRWSQVAVTLAVILLVVTAGCSGNNVIGGGDTTEADNTTTPVSTTNSGDVTGGSTGTTSAATETPNRATYPPGLSEQGITNVSALAAANRQALFAAGYVSGFELHGQTTREGTTKNMTMAQRETVTSNASKFLFQVKRQIGQQSSRTDIWSNGSTTLLRQERLGRASYKEMNASSVRPRLGGRQMLDTYLRTGEFTVESVNRTDQEAIYTLVASEYAKPSGTQLPVAENVSSYHGKVVVDSEGRIRQLRITMDYTGPKGGQATLLIRYALLERGSIEHPQPHWLRDAVANTTKTSEDDHSGHDH